MHSMLVRNHSVTFHNYLLIHISTIMHSFAILDPATVAKISSLRHSWAYE